MINVYIDESGNTGPDILNTDQPVYVLTAVQIEEEAAQAIFDDVFGEVNGSEIKLKNLFKRTQYDKILKIHDLVNEHGNFYSYVLDKEYMTICKFLDDCIEPIFHETGRDFYARGFNKATANLLSVFSRTKEYSHKIKDFLASYLKAVREKTDESIDRLLSQFSVLEEVEMECLFLAPGYQTIVKNNLKNKIVTSDLTFPVFFGLIVLLENNFLTPYKVIHDHSKSISHRLEDINAYMKDLEKSSEFNLGNGLKLSFPLKFDGFNFMDSKASKAVQLADIISGTLMRVAKELFFGDGDTDFVKELLSKYGKRNLIFDGHSNDVTAKDHSAGELINYCAGVLRRNDVRKYHEE